MKKLLWILSIFVFIACQNEQGGSEEATAADGSGTARETPGATTSSRGEEISARDPEAAAAVQKEKKDPVIGTRPVQPPTQFAGRLRLSCEEVTAATGENVCLKVMAGDFQEVITMQYSMRWDPGVLAFTGLKDLSLPYLTQNNFGTHRTGEGILTFVWIDNSLKGVNLPDGSALYQVCFDVKGTTGQSSPFRISGAPTPLESVNAEEKLLEIVPGEGKVTVR